MSNEHNPEGTVIPLESMGNNTIEYNARQGRRKTMGSYLPGLVIRSLTALGMLGSAVVLDASASSPQASAAGTEITRGSGKLTQVYGSAKPTANTLDVQFLLIDGATEDMARAVAPGLNIAAPFDQPKYKDRFRAWATTPTGDLDCNLTDIVKGCNLKLIQREIAITKAAGIVPHATVVLAKSHIDNWGGAGTVLTSPFEQPRVDNGYTFQVARRTPILIDLQSFAHEVNGIWFSKLTDAALGLHQEPNVGRGYANCTREPNFWKGLYGVIYTELKGCESDPQAYTIDDIMNRVTTGKFAPELWAYIDHVMDSLPGAYNEPADGPQILEPYGGGTTSDLSVKLKIAPKDEMRWVQYQVNPAGNDGPGVNMVYGDPSQVAKGEFKVPAPKIGTGPYIMLPGMSYQQRARTSEQALMPDTNSDTGWSLWSEDNLKTPPPSADTLRLPAGIRLAPNAETPFVWEDRNESNFYYEIQVSGDNRFNANSDTATSFVWWNLIHGGVTKPINSWTTPQRLEPNATYFWRVRPRVQGDGKPVEWGQTWAAKIGPDGKSYKISEVKTQ